MGHTTTLRTTEPEPTRGQAAGAVSHNSSEAARTGVVEGYYETGAHKAKAEFISTY
jgi:hypothetical protein